MSLLSIPELLDLAAGAGFSGSDLPTAVAIALAESAGKPDAINRNEPHGSSYGLWQIYTYMHPQFDPSSLLDPTYNAMAAFQVYQQAGGFRPWTTYTSGAFQSYLAQVNAAIAGSAPADPTAPGWIGETPTTLPFDVGTYWPFLAAAVGLLWFWMRG